LDAIPWHAPSLESPVVTTRRLASQACALADVFVRIRWWWGRWGRRWAQLLPVVLGFALDFCNPTVTVALILGVAQAHRAATSRDHVEVAALHFVQVEPSAVI